MVPADNQRTHERKPWFRPKWLIITFAAAVSLWVAIPVVGLAFLDLAWGYQGPESVSEIQRAFDENRSELEQLGAMLETGHPCSQVEESTGIERQDRCERYTSLLPKATPVGWRPEEEWRESRPLSFYLGGEGNYDQSYYIRVVYAESPPDSVVTDIFEHLEREGTGGYYSVYSPLARRWYVAMDMVW